MQKLILGPILLFVLNGYPQSALSQSKTGKMDRKSDIDIRINMDNKTGGGGKDSYLSPRRKITRNGADKAPIIELNNEIVGAATLGQPTSGYLWNFDAAVARLRVANFSGWNQATDSNAGRTGIATLIVEAQQRGNGDASAIYSTCTVDGVGKPQATSFLAQPACVIMNGDITSNIDGAYLNTFELNHRDDGHDIAVIPVLNFRRTNNVGAKGVIWNALRMQSDGSKALNAGLNGTGPFNIGVDFSLATADSKWNEGKTVALNMSAGQRITFNSTSSPIGGLNLYGNVLGDAYDNYSSTSKSLDRCKGSSCLRIADNSATFATHKASATSLIATNADFGKFSQAKLSASHGSGSVVEMVAGLGYGSLFSTQSLGVQVGGSTVFNVGSDAIYMMGGMQLHKLIVAQLPKCDSTIEGRLFAITDAASNAFNTVLIGGGSNHVMGYWNGANWTVH